MTANDQSLPSGISANGDWVLFSSHATNVMSDVTDVNGWLYDLFLYQRSTGSVSLVSHSVNSLATTSNSGSGSGLISADGSNVLFSSLASDIAPGVADGNGVSDVFIARFGLLSDGFEER